MSVQTCTRAPEGWVCSRDVDHDGPCAASRVTEINDLADMMYEVPGARLREVTTRITELMAQSVNFLTEDERRFFAYMAEQRFRTVSEKDPEKREAARARWREVALWFAPDWTGSGG